MIELMGKLPDQVFLEICEDAALKGVSVEALAKQMNTTKYYINRRRKELNFSKWFENKHKKNPKSVITKMSISTGKRETKTDLSKSKPKKIDFQTALQKKITDPDFLNAVYEKIAKSQLGEGKV